MTDKLPSWREVAGVLAERMANNAYCNTHLETEPGQDCPFCKDRAAYRLWERKSGRTHREAPYTGPTVDVFERNRADRAAVAREHTTN